MEPEEIVEMDMSRFNQGVNGRAVALINLVIYRVGQK